MCMHVQVAGTVTPATSQGEAVAGSEPEKADDSDISSQMNMDQPKDVHDVSLFDACDLH